MGIRRAIGTLEPIIYFENSVGEIALPPTTEEARWAYERKDARGKSYRDHGFEWREASTLPQVDQLQKKLMELHRRKMEREANHSDALMARKWAETGDALRQRMVSSSTTPYEREFIELYLKLREEKRSKHRQRFMEHNAYLEAREFDSGHHATDRVIGL